jgi:hypothetical protein
MKLSSYPDIGVGDCDFIPTGEIQEELTISATEHVLKEYGKIIEDCCHYAMELRS